MALKKVWHCRKHRATPKEEKLRNHCMEIDCPNLVTKKVERHNGDMTGVLTPEDVQLLKGRRTQKKEGARKNGGHSIVPYLTFPVHSSFY